MTLLGREVAVILNAYLLAGIPIALVALAGRASPMYRQPWARLARWWSWMALCVVAAAVVCYRLVPYLTGG